MCINFCFDDHICFVVIILYSEKVMVPITKPNITFQGQGYTSTAIVWNDTANSSHGTFNCGSVQVFSDNFIAKNISFMVRYIYLIPYVKESQFMYTDGIYNIILEVERSSNSKPW